MIAREAELRSQGWIFAAVIVSGCHQSVDSRPCASWTQWAHDSAHGGSTCVSGNSPGKVIASFTIDPFVSEENPPPGDGLLVHYQAPLVVGDDVYVMSKSSLRMQWTVPSDWKPIPSDLTRTEPMFQPVISGGLLYVPAGQGMLLKIDRQSGAVLGHVGLTSDPDLYVSGPLVADAAGNIYYNAIKLDHGAPATHDAKGWLVRVSPSDAWMSVSYDERRALDITKVV
jgi:hypothetical protein